MYAQDSEADPYMAAAVPNSPAADTYITISFESTEDSSDKKVYISKVLVFGNTKSASVTSYDPNYSVYAYTAVSSSNETPAYVQCGSDILTTCTERTCEQYSTGLKIQQREDVLPGVDEEPFTSPSLLLGGIVVFECNLTGFDYTETDDGSYRQGDEAETFTLVYSLDAECLEDEYDENIIWTYTVLKDDVEVESYSELTFDDNTVTIEIDEEYPDDDLSDEFTYTITIHGEIINHYGSDEIEDTFEV